MSSSLATNPFIINFICVLVLRFIKFATFHNSKITLRFSYRQMVWCFMGLQMMSSSNICHHYVFFLFLALVRVNLYRLIFSPSVSGVITVTNITLFYFSAQNLGVSNRLRQTAETKNKKVEEKLLAIGAIRVTSTYIMILNGAHFLISSQQYSIHKAKQEDQISI